MTRRTARAALAIVLAAVLSAASTAFPGVHRLHGLSIDVLTWLRWTAFGASHDPQNSPTAVIVLDEETYRTPPYAGTPSITWTQDIARVLLALRSGGVAVVGFDVIFPTSLEQSEIAIGDTTLGERVRGLDRDFLRALATLAREGRVVLGEVQHARDPVVPFEAQRLAIGGPKNIRPLNVVEDADGIVRRIPISFASAHGRVPSMAVELAARRTGARPKLAHDGGLLSDGPGQATLGPEPPVLNFEGGSEDIPTFSFADMAACARAGRSDFFRQHFQDRVVMIGVLLDLEDRVPTSKRFVTGIEGAWAPRCVLPLPPPTSGRFSRETIAGVQVHATAVNNLVRGETLAEPSLPVRIAVGATGGAVAALVALLMQPLSALLALVAVLLGWTGVTVWAFSHAMVLPFLDTVAAAMVALALTVGYRLIVADSDKRLLRSSFGLYLAPELIERMLASNTLPKLGGETREITVYFSDLAGFSALSEQLAPSEVVDVLNSYLAEMTQIIEARGGFVDKYVGDAIVAIFGAPIDDRDHASSATRASLEAEARLVEMRQTGLLPSAQALRQRIGIATGLAVVGNVGSSRRFNYTAMGDTVNLASRLEGANKHFGTTILVSEATFEKAGASVVWREIDTITVVGRDAPIRVYEPLGEAADTSVEQVEIVAAYSEGLARWRRGEFEQATAYFAKIAHRDPPSSRFCERIAAMPESADSAGWEPVNHLKFK